MIGGSDVGTHNAMALTPSDQRPTAQAPVAVSVPQLQEHLSAAAHATRSLAVALTHMLLAGTTAADGHHGDGAPTKPLHAGFEVPTTASAPAAAVLAGVQKLLEGSKPLMCMWETRDVDVAAGALWHAATNHKPLYPTACSTRSVAGYMGVICRPNKVQTAGRHQPL